MRTKRRKTIHVEKRKQEAAEGLLRQLAASAQLGNAQTDLLHFLELIYKTANCDGTFAEEEEELIDNYKIELGLSEIKDTASMEELMDRFGDKPAEKKKIIFFELYGMIMSDDTIAEEEAHILSQLKSKFKLSPAEYDQILSAADSLQAAYDKVYEALF